MNLKETFKNMPRYDEPELRSPLIPAGTYIARVRDIEHGLSTGAKTGGSPQYTITLDLKSQPEAWVYDRLIDSENTAWRINAFVKAIGYKLERGTDFEFIGADSADGVPFLNPVGRYCWVTIGIETFKTKNNTDAKKNVVESYVLSPTPQQIAQLDDPKWGTHTLPIIEKPF